MVIAVAISPAELGPSPVPILEESLAVSGDDDDVPVVGVGFAVEAFVNIAASGELGDSPSRPAKQKRKGTVQSQHTKRKKKKNLKSEVTLDSFTAKSTYIWNATYRVSLFILL